MSRILITGSSEGLGLMAGQLLAAQGHEVVLHARNAARRADARRALPQALEVLEGDVSSLDGMRSVARQANALGRFDAVVHNVAVGYQETRRLSTADGLPHVFAVNMLAPYVLTALVRRPDRLVYLSSGLHRQADAHLDDVLWAARPWNGMQAYSESKLLDAMLAFAVARKWPDVVSTALEPGWVQTRMGGPGATDDLQQGHLTQAWLASSSDARALVSGAYYYHLQPMDAHPQSRDVALQERLLAICAELSGLALHDGGALASS